MNLFDALRSYLRQNNVTYALRYDKPHQIEYLKVPSHKGLYYHIKVSQRGIMIVRYRQVKDCYYHDMRMPANTTYNYQCTTILDPADPHSLDKLLEIIHDSLRSNS